MKLQHSTIQKNTSDYLCKMQHELIQESLGQSWLELVLAGRSPVSNTGFKWFLFVLFLITTLLQVSYCWSLKHNYLETIFSLLGKKKSFSAFKPHYGFLQDDKLSIPSELPIGCLKAQKPLRGLEGKFNRSLNETGRPGTQAIGASFCLGATSSPQSSALYKYPSG